MQAANSVQYKGHSSIKMKKNCQAKDFGAMPSPIKRGHAFNDHTRVDESLFSSTFIRFSIGIWSSHALNSTHVKIPNSQCAWWNWRRCGEVFWLHLPQPIETWAGEASSRLALVIISSACNNGLYNPDLGEESQFREEYERYEWWIIIQ